MKETSTSRAFGWMSFVGVLLFLMGVYGALRIAHVELRKVPYPSAGVFPPTILTPNQNFSPFGRESECEIVPQVYYDYETNGKMTVRPSTEEEKLIAEKNMQRCIKGFDEDRAKQEQRDKTQAAFLVFVGSGLLFARRFVK